MNKDIQAALNSLCSSIVIEEQNNMFIDELSKLVAHQNDPNNQDRGATNNNDTPISSINREELYKEIVSTIEYLQQLLLLQDKYKYIDIKVGEEDSTHIKINIPNKSTYISSISADRNNDTITIHLNKFPFSLVNPIVYNYFVKHSEIEMESSPSNPHPFSFSRYNGFDVWSSLPLHENTLHTKLSNASTTLHVPKNMLKAPTFSRDINKTSDKDGLDIVSELYLIYSTVGMALFPAQAYKILNIINKRAQADGLNISSLQEDIDKYVQSGDISMLPREVKGIIYLFNFYFKSRWKYKKEYSLNFTNAYIGEFTRCPHPHSPSSVDNMANEEDGIGEFTISTGSCLGGNQFTDTFTKFKKNNERDPIYLSEGIDKLLEWVSVYNLTDAYHTKVHPFIDTKHSTVLNGYYALLNNPDTFKLIEAFASNDVNKIVDAFLYILEDVDRLVSLLFVYGVNPPGKSHSFFKIVNNLTQSNLYNELINSNGRTFSNLLYNNIAMINLYGVTLFNLAQRIMTSIAANATLPSPEFFDSNMSQGLSVFFKEFGTLYLPASISSNTNGTEGLEDTLITEDTFKTNFLPKFTIVDVDRFIEEIRTPITLTLTPLHINHILLPTLLSSLYIYKYNEDEVKSFNEMRRSLFKEFTKQVIKDNMNDIPVDKQKDLTYLYEHLCLKDFQQPNLIQQIIRDIWLANKLTMNVIALPGLLYSRGNSKSYVEDWLRTTGSSLPFFALSGPTPMLKVPSSYILDSINSVLSLLYVDSISAYFSSYNYTYILEIIEKTVKSFSTLYMDHLCPGMVYTAPGRSTQILKSLEGAANLFKSCNIEEGDWDAFIDTEEGVRLDGRLTGDLVDTSTASTNGKLANIVRYLNHSLYDIKEAGERLKNTGAGGELYFNSFYDYTKEYSKVYNLLNVQIPEKYKALLNKDPENPSKRLIEANPDLITKPHIFKKYIDEEGVFDNLFTKDTPVNTALELVMGFLLDNDVLSVYLNMQEAVHKALTVHKYTYNSMLGNSLLAMYHYYIHNIGDTESKRVVKVSSNLLNTVVTKMLSPIIPSVHDQGVEWVYELFNTFK